METDEKLLPSWATERRYHPEQIPWVAAVTVLNGNRNTEH